MTMFIVKTSITWFSDITHTTRTTSLNIGLCIEQQDCELAELYSCYHGKWHTIYLSLVQNMSKTRNIKYLAK